MHTNSIHEFDPKNVAITINITKNSSKVFFSKYRWGHDGKYEGWERKSQTSPRLRGGKSKLDCREQSTGVIGNQVVDQRSTDSSDGRKIWRCSRLHQKAADARHGPRKRDFCREVGARENFGWRRSLLSSQIWVQILG